MTADSWVAISFYLTCLSPESEVSTLLIFFFFIIVRPNTTTAHWKERRLAWCVGGVQCGLSVVVVRLTFHTGQPSCC